MNDEVVNILANNLANQAIMIAKQQSEINQLKKLLVKANDEVEKKGVKADEHTDSNVDN